jgi:hypothetical protein
MAFSSYFLQFQIKKPWLHTVFHVFLHVAGIVVALDPVQKYTPHIHANWAWPVWLLGAWALAPPAALLEGRKAPLFTDVIT